MGSLKSHHIAMKNGPSATKCAHIKSLRSNSQQVLTLASKLAVGSAEEVVLIALQALVDGGLTLLSGRIEVPALQIRVANADVQRLEAAVDVG